MNQQQKEDLFTAAKTHVAFVRESIMAKKVSLIELIGRTKSRFKEYSFAEKMAHAEILSSLSDDAGDMDHLYDSPYFVRCDMRYDGDEEPTSLYFAKFPLLEQSIYSWTSPVAALRFEKPGLASYTVKGDNTWSGTIVRKDQYMIARGHILFMTTESLGAARELVYQEHLSQRKSSFILPEIVAKMEKIQDEVIRADYRGPFLISGPAGSGKTTLALHRVAFLLQSPDTSELFLSDQTLVLVHDESTQIYFSALLPELGVKNVIITTFGAWALEMLSITDHRFVTRFGRSEGEKNSYEFAKYQAMRTEALLPYSKNIRTLLTNMYGKTFTVGQQKLLTSQLAQKVLDRFDLTILLKSFIAQHGSLQRKDYYYKQVSKKSDRVTRVETLVPVTYSLALLDEVQNFLPEQIEFLSGLLEPKTNAIIYVGDLAQQTNMCTMRRWDQVGQHFEPGRIVVLQKNYRSQKRILEFIRECGYLIEIPEGIAEGGSASETVISNKSEEIRATRLIAENNTDTIVGVLSKSEEYLVDFKRVLADLPHVKVLNIHEAQGVEFGTVCLVGVSRHDFIPPERDETDRAFIQEVARVNRDLLYVSLTRAMDTLYVSGTDSLKSILNELTALL